MYRWHALLGKFQFDERRVVFQGETTTILNQPAAAIGNAISDQRFSGGMMRGTIRFSEIRQDSACQFIVSYAPATGAFVAVGIAVNRRRAFAGTSGSGCDRARRGIWRQQREAGGNGVRIDRTPDVW